MGIDLIIIIICWVLFGLYWLVNSFFQKQSQETPLTFNKIISQLFFSLPFVFLIRPDWFKLDQIIIKNSMVNIISIAICIIGLIICIWARKTLADNWSKSLDFKKGHELIQTGPYSTIRHPIYTGFLLMFFALALDVGKIGGLIGFAVLLIGVFLRIKQEEDLLIKHFKEKYILYKNKTKALLPYIIALSGN
jgi:protein-S-isoprenylcysteine O-methyltransferase Ste14